MRSTILGYILGITHLVIALWAYSQPHDGSWGYFPVAIVDFPLTLILGYTGIAGFFGPDFSWLLFIVLGTLWWYLVGLWIQRGVDYVIKRQNQREN